MSKALENLILNQLTASKITDTQQIQSLWSGYGQIVRYALEGAQVQSVVVKHVKLPDAAEHPRGWNTDISHQRKIKSYQVESNWYQHWASQCDDGCRVPQCFAVESSESEFFVLLEDLDASGFPIRKDTATTKDMKNCLRWLANFHATFLFIDDEASADSDKISSQLWPIGTYWHLQTRPDELRVLEDSALKNAAAKIDQKLDNCQFKTLVHGDAKLANFCFSDASLNSDSESEIPVVNPVAAVDFQYVGGGCGMKDVAYFIGSCLYEEDCEKYESELLDYYFQSLAKSLLKKNTPNDVDLEALELEWRELFYFAWADFHRFLKGWSPGHWKINGYSERVTQQVIESLSGQLN